MRHTKTLIVGGMVTLMTAMPLMAQDAIGGAALPDRASGTLPPHLDKGVSLWDDYIHYLHVAQPEMVLNTGKAFLELELEATQLLLVVDELSRFRGNFAKAIDRGERMQGEVGELTRQVAEAIKQARLKLAREDERIQKAIDQLDDGERPRVNARERLQMAGEYAAPLMLKALMADNEKLRPYVRQELVHVGRGVVVPLCEAMPYMKDAVVKQQIAGVLADIGYAASLPYLQRELETNKDMDAETRKVLTAAFDQIVARTAMPKNIRAANLFHMLAEDYYYERESLIQDPESPTNLVWYYKEGTGLLGIPVPTQVFHDAMSMQASRRALQLDPELAGSLSLWVASNIRRENNLTEEAPDRSYGPPIYGTAMRSAHFYAAMAGPDHLHPALARALKDSDSEQSLDVIAALRAVANPKQLVNIVGEDQPLVAAMNYPDQRVRFEAAFAIAESRPRIQFAGAQRVVPVLAEAVHGPTEQPHALVLTRDEVSDLNKAIEVLKSAGDYKIIQGKSVETVLEDVYRSPWISLVIIKASSAQAQEAVAAIRLNAKLRAAPVLVLAPTDQLITMNQILGAKKGVFVADEQSTDEQLTEAVNRAAEYAKGVNLDEDQSLYFCNHSSACCWHCQTISRASSACLMPRRH